VGASARWEDRPSKHDDCDADGDCALAYPGCPLGSAAAVMVSDVDEAEAKAERLVNRHERPGRAGEHEGVEMSGVACAAGRCAVVWSDG